MLLNRYFTDHKYMPTYSTNSLLQSTLMRVIHMVAKLLTVIRTRMSKVDHRNKVKPNVSIVAKIFGSLTSIDVEHICIRTSTNQVFTMNIIQLK